MLDEVIITAQKREENVLDVPASVDVVTARNLQENNVARLEDLQTIAPSLQTVAGINTYGLAMRGVSSFASPLGAPSKVGVIIDDVPQSTRSTLAYDLNDVERVEILPGPQATLSGRNATGGLINYVTRGPSDTLTGSGEITLTDDHETRLKAFVAGPITDQLSFSLSGFSNRFRGVAHNSWLDSWAVRRSEGLRGKLRWSPTDRFDLTLTAFYQRSHQVRPGSVYLSSDPATRLLFDLRGRPLVSMFTMGEENRDYQSARDAPSKTTEYGGVIRAEYDFGQATFTSITSIYKQRQTSTGDFVIVPLADLFSPTPLPADWDGLQHNKDDDKTFTQEFRVASPTDTQLQYILGAFYTRDETNFDVVRPFFPVNWDRNFVYDSLALFGHVTYEIADSWFVSGGLRWQHDKQNYTWDFHAIPFVNPEIRSAGSFTDSFWSGDIGLRKKFGENHTAYATISRGEQGQVYDGEDNATAQAGTLKPLPPERVTGYAAGLKGQLLGQRLIYDVNAFYSEYQDYLVLNFNNTNDPTRPPTFQLAALGKVTTKGVEANLSGQLTDQLRVSAGAAYIDAVMESFQNARCYTFQTPAQGCVGGVQDLSGRPMPSSPKWKVNLGATYTVPLNSLPFDLDLGAFYRFQSKTQHSLEQDPSRIEGAYGIVNLNAALRQRDGAYAVELFVNNLFDTHYAARLGGPFLASGAATTITLPRDWQRYAGVRFSGKF
jgi:iron complex outermembrane receptor protein